MSIRKTRSAGFTLIEVLGAIFILAFGLLALAGLMSNMNVNTSQSRYMSNEALLASEKLEDLNRYPACDPAMVAGGSLTSDVTQTNTPVSPCSTPGEPVDYFDQVQISTDNGMSSEITTGKNSSGSAGYWLTNHTPDGHASSQFIVGNTPAASPDMLVFKRRWIIEANQPVSGLRRITVLVTLIVPVAESAGGSFQTSLVRP